ncbi:MAG TPA: 50S ribosomal protein L18 [Acidimicrobiia bacterium]|nr:50S ribosomal protein L18 [Acidimicrobiia bacterium]
MSKSRESARKIRHYRVRKRVSGTPARPRLAVFRSNRYIYAQVIDDVAGHTLASASSTEKDLRGERLSIETASKIGKLIAERAQSAGVGKVVFDRGGFPFHGRVKALADAAREAGLDF